MGTNTGNGHRKGQVKNRKQAIAIALNRAGISKNRRTNGKKRR